MPETLEPKVKETLRNYVREMKSLPNEAAKRSRFAALIAELFPGTSAVTDYSRGIEKLLRISRPSGVKKGRADAYYGNAIIEFEKSLSATLAEAEGQLREYVLFPQSRTDALEEAYDLQAGKFAYRLGPLAVERW